MNLKNKEFWDKQVELNSKDAYSKACIEAAQKVMEALDAGKTPKEAHDEMYGLGLSGFMAGCVAQIVSQAHMRGEEFNDFWNESWGVPKGTKGTVNPAIVTIKTGEE